MKIIVLTSLLFLSSCNYSLKEAQEDFYKAKENYEQVRDFFSYCPRHALYVCASVSN